MDGYDAYKIAAGLLEIARALDRIASAMDTDSVREYEIVTDWDKAKEVIRDAIIEAK